MNLPPTPAILLRRIEHGDYDLILTFLTRDRGKIGVMAKSAKKSKKRFAGVLEPFAVLEIVYSGPGRRRGLPILQEASLVHPYSGIRGNVLKTAYASYWAQLIAEWTEAHVKESALFELYRYALAAMERGEQSADTLSVLFQIRFLDLAGLAPGLDRCSVCETPIGVSGERRMPFDLVRGGVVCAACTASGPSRTTGRILSQQGSPRPRSLRLSSGQAGQAGQAGHVAPAGQAPGVGEGRATYRLPGGVRSERISLSMGTIKPLLWMQHNDLKTAGRVRFTPSAARESLTMLEAFVPYHLGKDPRSLKFLQRIRK
ncbi:hypothetical protein D3OALGB2SA_4134 [Olavius algarvensis associated proteobacterium Delta 3]|nr:hypothetical protein D3OALGB2SA_4134 [Olavius algarvensis associated proteobacterium Delta 3]